MTQTMFGEEMDYVELPGLEQEVSRIGMGTRAIGGSGWGGTDPEEAIQALHSGFYRGVNLVHTSPEYGYGLAEEIVGSAIDQFEDLDRDEIVVAGSTGPPETGDTEQIPVTGRNVREKVEASLDRTQFKTFDLYMLQFPESQSSFDGVAGEVKRLQKEGKIRGVGLVDASTNQLSKFAEHLTPAAVQLRFNLFEQPDGREYVSFCEENETVFFACGVLCRGLLTGSVTEETEFKRDDLRKNDPKFKKPDRKKHLQTVERIDKLARANYDRRVIHLAVRFVLEKGADVGLWGVRKPGQTEPFDDLFGWELQESDVSKTEDILKGSRSS